MEEFDKNICVSGRICTPNEWHEYMEVNTHIDFSVYDVNETAKHNDEIKHIPRITKVILSRKQPMKKKHKVYLVLQLMNGRKKTTNGIWLSLLQAKLVLVSSKWKK